MDNSSKTANGKPEDYFKKIQTVIAILDESKNSDIKALLNSRDCTVIRDELLSKPDLFLSLLMNHTTFSLLLANNYRESFLKEIRETPDILIQRLNSTESAIQNAEHSDINLPPIFDFMENYVMPYTPSLSTLTNSFSSLSSSFKSAFPTCGTNALGTCFGSSIDQNNSDETKSKKIN